MLSGINRPTVRSVPMLEKMSLRLVTDWVETQLLDPPDAGISPAVPLEKRVGQVHAGVIPLRCNRLSLRSNANAIPLAWKVTCSL